MANNATLPSRLGQINATGAADALFLKVFSGEVLTSFKENNIMDPHITTRTIQYGKTAQFPVLGVATAGFHTPGDSIVDSGNSYLSRIKAAEKIIGIDGIMQSSAFIAQADELQNHYDVRAPYATELGKALAFEYDRRAIRVAILASRAASPWGTSLALGSGRYAQMGISKYAATDTTLATNNGCADYSALVNAGLRTTGSAIVSALFDAARAFDDANIPSDGRFFACTPQQYYQVVQTKDCITTYLNGDGGGNGSFAAGTVKQVAGITLLKTTHLPIAAVAAVTGENSANTYAISAGATLNAGLCFHSSCMGVVKLKDLTMESQYLITHQGTLFVSKFMLGMGILRAEAAIELSIS